MERLKNFLSGSAIMLLALVLGGAASIAAFVWIDSQQTAATENAAALSGDAPRESVLIVREPIVAGKEITSAMVELQEVNPAAVLPGALKDVDDVVGRVARYPLVAGEQILPSRLVGGDAETGTGLAFTVPPGMRALSVAVTEVSGAGGLIVPGDRVDVLVSTEYGNLFGPRELVVVDTEQDVEGHPTVITVLQDVLVLAVAQEVTTPVDADRDPATLRSESAEVQPDANSVTLAVGPDETQRLFMASQHGTIGLALRSFGDSDTTVLNPLLKLEAADNLGTGFAANR